MSLIQLLQEASSLPLDDLKKAVKKDATAAPVLKAGAKLEDIPDVEKFLATVKFHILNNEQVRKFVASRSNVKEVHKMHFDDLRKLRASDFDQDKLDYLTDFVKSLFKEHGTVVKGGMSTELKRKLNDWFNNSGTYYTLPTWAERELDSIPGIKPAGRIILYRGVLFSEDSLKERKKYDGTLEAGNGLKFLRSIRQDKRTVDLDWDRPSSWTKSKEVADRFARYAPSSSQFGAMMGWFEREKQERFIDGALGYVIAIYANPEDVLIDTEKFNANFHMKHGDEREVVLKPGTYTVRIVKKYTVKGEVDPEAAAESAPTTVLDSIEKVKSLADRFTLDKDLTDAVNSIGNGWRVNDSANMLKDVKLFSTLATKGATTIALSKWEQLMDFYNKELVEVNVDDLRADNFLGDEETAKKAQALKDLISWFKSKVRHSQFKDGRSNSTGPKHELSATEYRKTIKADDISSLEPALLVGTRVTDYRAGNAIADFARHLGVSIPASAKPHQFGKDKQQAMLNDILQAFFQKLNLDASEDLAENKRNFINIMKIAYRNQHMIHDMSNAQKLIQKVAGNAAE